MFGFGSRRAPELNDQDLEYVWLGDVETGHYASVLGSPRYQQAVQALARGEKLEDPPIRDAEQFINDFTPNGKSIASLIKTGFLSAQDYVVLDNSAATLREVREAGGVRGLETLLTLATPRKEKYKRELLHRYEETNQVPEANRRFKIPKLEEFQPGVQTYIWALDEAARKRQRHRMRRRAIAKGRQNELRYDAYLRRGGAPFRGYRTDAETHKAVTELVPDSGKAYMESGHICSYWYDPTLKRWTRMIGVDTSAENKRKALLANRGRIQEIEDVHDFEQGRRRQISYGFLTDDETSKLYKCLDKDGNRSLQLHQEWFEHKYALPVNKGECEGLCSFSDGWIIPEGEDGIPNDLALAFDAQGEPLATHLTCASCNTRLCRKCYWALMQYHTEKGSNLAKFAEMYHLYRYNKIKYPFTYTTYENFITSLKRKTPSVLQNPVEDQTQSGNHIDAENLPVGVVLGAEHLQVAQLQNLEQWRTVKQRLEMKRQEDLLWKWEKALRKQQACAGLSQNQQVGLQIATELQQAQRELLAVKRRYKAARELASYHKMPIQTDSTHMARTIQQLQNLTDQDDQHRTQQDANGTAQQEAAGTVTQQQARPPVTPGRTQAEARPVGDDESDDDSSIAEITSNTFWQSIGMAPPVPPATQGGGGPTGDGGSQNTAFTPAQLPPRNTAFTPAQLPPRNTEFTPAQLPPRNTAFTPAQLPPRNTVPTPVQQPPRNTVPTSVQQPPRNTARTPVQPPPPPRNIPPQPRTPGGGRQGSTDGGSGQTTTRPTAVKTPDVQIVNPWDTPTFRRRRQAQTSPATGGSGRGAPSTRGSIPNRGGFPTAGGRGGPPTGGRGGPPTGGRGGPTAGRGATQQPPVAQSPETKGKPGRSGDRGTRGAPGGPEGRGTSGATRALAGHGGTRD